MNIGRFQRAPAAMTGAQHNTDLASLRYFVPSGQIRRFGPPSLTHDPPLCLGFRVDVASAAGETPTTLAGGLPQLRGPHAPLPRRPLRLRRRRHPRPLRCRPGRAAAAHEANIRRNLARLVTDAHPWESLFFHYSGHDTRLSAETGHDDDDTDHDECIVPCDMNLITGPRLHTPRSPTVVLSTTKLKKQNKPAVFTHKTVMHKEFRKMAKAVKNQKDAVIILHILLGGLCFCSSLRPTLIRTTTSSRTNWIMISKGWWE